jgi:hypothetical protein
VRASTCPEVGDNRVAVLEQDILGLDVAVNDTAAVRILQGVGDFVRDAERLGDRKLRVTFQAIAERFAVDEWHDVIQEARAFARVEEGQDVRVA